ncbi:MAG: ZIP family metal transporter [Planctomycetaceae bacterium]
MLSAALQQAITIHRPSVAIALIGVVALLLVPSSLIRADVSLHRSRESDSATTKHAHSHDHHHDGHNHGSSAHDHEGEVEGHGNSAAVLIWGLTVLYGLAIAGASYVGGILPRLVNLTHTRIQLLLSFVGGLMLGIGVMHMLPHAVHGAPAESIDTLMYAVTAGVLLMFGLLRAFHFHVHEPPSVDDPTVDGQVSPFPQLPPHHDHCDHNHGSTGHSASWIGVFFGLSVHTLLDGVALGASIQAEAAHASGWGLYGLGVAAAIALHKPMDSLSIATLMSTGGTTPGRRALVNVGYAALCPIGAGLFHLGVAGLGVGGESSLIVPCTLAFSAGMFLTISLSDLLPEMQFHSHNRVRLSAALLLGVAAAWAIGFLEPAHLHGH